MVNKFPRTSEMIDLCMSISTLDLNFENSVTLVPDSNLRKERILNIRILKNKAFLRLLFAYIIGSLSTALPHVCHGARSRGIGSCCVAHDH